jgi:hypothetical protein
MSIIYFNVTEGKASFPISPVYQIVNPFHAATAHNIKRVTIQLAHTKRKYPNHPREYLRTSALSGIPSAILYGNFNQTQIKVYESCVVVIEFHRHTVVGFARLE